MQRLQSIRPERFGPITPSESDGSIIGFPLR